MCYQVSTPDKEEIEVHIKKQTDIQPALFVNDGVVKNYLSDGFTRPLLPFTSSESPNTVELAQWKLLPFVVKNEEDAKKYANTLNARSEDVFTKFSYKNYIGKTRGLLWVDGFFEPNHPKPKVTVPYYIKAANGEPFTLGCVYSNWVNKDTGEVIKTFSIITTPPNVLLGKIHNDGKRMPLIITPENRNKWLSNLSKDDIIAMMLPLDDGFLDGYPVSNIVYKRGLNTNIPEVQVPVEIDESLQIQER